MTQALPFFQVDAFARQAFEGNPAAVMPLAEWLPDATMQAIAAENNLSETAFTVPLGDGDGADYHLRWFTPTIEMKLCGHATLASAHVLIERDDIRFRTLSGVLTVTRRDGLLALDLPSYPVTPGEEAGLLAALGVAEGTPSYLAAEGNRAAIVLLPDEEAVRAVAPDFSRLRTIDRLVIVTAPGRNTAVTSRVFAAFHGVDEDPVTGSAHCSLVPFWAERLGRARFDAYQASKRGGHLDCTLDGDRVILAGSCVTTVEGHFQL